MLIDRRHLSSALRGLIQPYVLSLIGLMLAAGCSPGEGGGALGGAAGSTMDGSGGGGATATAARQLRALYCQRASVASATPSTTRACACCSA